MGASNSLPSGDRRRLLVIGGGYTAFWLIPALEKEGFYDVTLVDRKDYWENNTAGVRFFVQPEFHTRTSIKYSDWFKSTQFVQGEAISVNDTQAEVRTPTGEVIKLSFDACILATGSSYNSVWKAEDTSLSDRRSTIETFSARLKQANHVVVVGGGATGVEFATEIRGVYPSKKITIVHSGDRVLPKNPLKASRLAAARLAALNVDVILNDKVVETSADGVVRTTGGKTIDGDCVIQASGPTMNSAFVSKLLPDAVDPKRGEVKTTLTMQVEHHPSLFAIGDVWNLPQEKTAFSLKDSAPFLVGNLNRYFRGVPLKRWSPSKQAQFPGLIIMGPKYGILSLGPVMTFALAKASSIKEDFWTTLPGLKRKGQK